MTVLSDPSVRQQPEKQSMDVLASSPVEFGAARYWAAANQSASKVAIAAGMP